jgi:hypothetical protein
MKNTDPLMGAKLKSKTHLQNTFFDFLSRFLRVWLQSLKKVLTLSIRRKKSAQIGLKILPVAVHNL